MLLEGLQISGGQANFLQLPTHVLGQPRFRRLTDFREIPRGRKFGKFGGAEKSAEKFREILRARAAEISAKFAPARMADRIIR